MERFRCRAVVLSSTDYGDSDRIVTLLTDERGRLAAFAHGARKSRRRFAGALEPFTLLEVELVETRGDTSRLDRAEVLDGFGELRTELAGMARGAYALELSRELCREREPHPELFALLLRLLHGLAREGTGALGLMRFELAALAQAGLMPRFDRCARCGRLPEGAHFAPDLGGLLCGGCSPGAGFRVSMDAARALAVLQRPAGEATAPADHVRVEARGLLERYIVHHLGRRPKSLDFMREVGVEP